MTTEDTAVEARNIYRVHEANMEAARDLVAKVNRKARRYGLSEYTLVTRDRVETPVYATDVTGYVIEPRQQIGVEIGFDVELVGEMPQIDGWSFVATLDYAEDSGVITRPVPGVEVDLSAHRARPNECDHCGTTRRRTNTYVLRNRKGDTMQVGSSCIQPYMGLSVNGLAWLAAEPFAEMAEYREPREGGPRADTHFLVTTILTVTMACEQVEGWRSRAIVQEHGGISTSARVVEFLTGTSKYAREWQNTLRESADWDAAEAKAATVRAWAIEQDGTSEYATNLRTLAAGNTVTWRNVGILASAVAGYNREQGEAIKREKRTDPKWIGNVGDKKVSVTGEVVHTMRMAGYAYNSPDRELIMVRTDDALVKWWASSPQGFDRGDRVTITGTIKAHETYNGEQHTVFTRAKMEAAPEGTAN